MLLKETNFPSFKVLSYVFAFGLGVASVFIGRAIAKVSLPLRFYSLSSNSPYLYIFVMVSWICLGLLDALAVKVLHTVSIEVKYKKPSI